MSYVIVGGVCLFIGTFFGMFISALTAISADDEGTERSVSKDADR